MEWRGAKGYAERLATSELAAFTISTNLCNTSMSIDMTTMRS